MVSKWVPVRFLGRQCWVSSATKSWFSTRVVVIMDVSASYTERDETHAGQGIGPIVKSIRFAMYQGLAYNGKA